MSPGATASSKILNLLIYLEPMLLGIFITISTLQLKKQRHSGQRLRGYDMVIIERVPEHQTMDGIIMDSE